MVRVGKKSDSLSAEEKMKACLYDLHLKIHTVHSKKLRVDDSLKAALSYQEKLDGVSRLGQQHKSKLTTLYSSALRELEAEASVLRSCLDEVVRVRRVQLSQRLRCAMRRGALMLLLAQSARSLPLWIAARDTDTPALCGALPAPDSLPLIPGDSVAALVDENWILADVLTSINNGSKYEVEDVDEEQKLHYTLARRRLIPLPRWRANPVTDPHALFPVEAIVLALYPQTTCFYKGVIEHAPSTPADDYLIAFEDPSYPHGYSPPLSVPQRYVVAYRPAKK